MIRKRITFVMAFVLCLSLVACSGSSGSDDTVKDDGRENGAVRAESTIARSSDETVEDDTAGETMGDDVHAADEGRGYGFRLSGYFCRLVSF